MAGDGGMTCAVEGCEREAKVRGWCHSHYAQWRRTGDPVGTSRSTLSERFWSKVALGGSDECWEWQAARRTAGYGAFKIGGRQGKIHNAHRIAWVLTHGEIEDELFVLHRCDNRPCCNPAHLFLGTQLDNMRDMFAKGRRPPAVGERSGNARLTEAAVIAARANYGGRSGEVKALCVKYGVHKNTMLAALHRRTWKHVA
jgi:hypothetical protein